MRTPMPPDEPFQFFASKYILDCNFFKYRSYLAPLYLYEKPNKEDMFEGDMVKRPNFKKAFVEFIEKKYGKRVSSSVGEGLVPSRATGDHKGLPYEFITPEQIFGYIYAVLYSPTYREKYLELLKIDFPRVPFTDDEKLFFELSEIGNRLVDLHTMKTKSWGEYRQIGDADDPTVGKRHYDEKAQEIILDTKRPKEEWVRIGKVPKEVWEYKIGGYQVVDKWLDYRAGRQISIGDVCEILNALTETIKIQKQIDEVYKKGF